VVGTAQELQHASAAHKASLWSSLFSDFTVRSYRVGLNTISRARPSYRLASVCGILMAAPRSP